MAGRRKVYDRKTKDLVVKLVQTRKLSVKEASDKYEVQPFQVLAWIGESALRSGDTPTEHPRVLSAGLPPAPDVHTGDTGLLKALSDEAAGSTIDPSLAQAIGEWWLKNRLPKELAKADGGSSGTNQD